jgi:hypothetical protein
VTDYQRRVCPICAEWFARDSREVESAAGLRWWLHACSRDCWRTLQDLDSTTAGLLTSIANVAQLVSDPWATQALRTTLRVRTAAVDDAAPDPSFHGSGPID